MIYKNSTKLILLLLIQNLQAQVTLQDFKKSSLATDLSAWVGNDLVLQTATPGTSGWFYYPKALKLSTVKSYEIEITVREPSRDAGLDLSGTLDPSAKNGAYEQPDFIRLINCFGEPGGNLYLMTRSKGGAISGEYLNPFPTGAHSLKMSVTSDSVTLYLLNSGVWRKLKSLHNLLPDSIYVSVAASKKWVLAAGQIVTIPKVIVPPVPKIVYAAKVTMTWNRSVEKKVKYRAHLGLTSRSYPMSWITPDTFFVFTNLDTGRVYFGAVTAIDSAGNESAYSDEVSFVRRDTTKADPLDLTGDKIVNLADYTLLKLNYGKSGKGDFDNDGIVSELDLLWFWRFGKFDVEN